MGNQSPAGGL